MYIYANHKLHHIGETSTIQVITREYKNQRRKNKEERKYEITIITHGKHIHVCRVESEHIGENLIQQIAIHVANGNYFIELKECKDGWNVLGKEGASK